MRRLLLACLLLCLVPGGAGAAVVSGPNAQKVSLTVAGDRLLAVWNRGAISGGTFESRLLSRAGEPAGPVRTIGTTAAGFGITMPPAVVWNPSRREFLVAFQATGPGLRGYPCGPYCMQNDVEIYTRVLDRHGRPKGRARQVSSTGPASQVLLTATRPGLALDPESGQALVTFTAVTEVNGMPTRVLRAQRIGFDGRRRGAPGHRDVGRTRPDPEHRTAPRRGDGWTVVYEHMEVGTVQAQVVSGRGKARGPARAVLSKVAGQSPGAALVYDPRTGRTLGLWQRSTPASPSGAYVTRVIGADGRPTGREQELPRTAGFKDVSGTATAKGWALLETVFVPGGERDVFLSRLGRTGTLAGPGVRLTTYAPAAGTPSGTYSFRAPYETAIAAFRGRLIGAWAEQLRGPGPQVAPPEVVARVVG